MAPTPVTLNASACPAVQYASNLLTILYSKTSGNLSNAPVSESICTTTFVLNVIQPSALRHDLTAGGACSEIYHIEANANSGNSLKLVAPGSGLLLTVKAGRANCQGLIELASDTTKAIPASAGRYWIWLSQVSGGEAFIPDPSTSLTPPAGANVLLGSAVTDGTNITAVDFSGVLYGRGGAIWRYSADPGIPTDTPASGLSFYAQTAFGLFVWDGSAYQQVTVPEVSADPTSLANGMMWFRSDTQKLSRRTGGSTLRTAAFT